MAQQDIVIVAAARTAVGKFGGSLAKVAAPELGATVLKALLERTGVASEQIGEVILGQVLQAGAGQNAAGQGLSDHDGAQIGRGHLGQRAAELADGGTGGREDDDVFPGNLSP